MFYQLSNFFAVISLVCWALILIQAFQSAIWKGVLALVCGVYLIYFAFLEYEAKHRWKVVILAFACAGMAKLLRLLS